MNDVLLFLIIMGFICLLVLVLYGGVKIRKMDTHVKELAYKNKLLENKIIQIKEENHQKRQSYRVEFSPEECVAQILNAEELHLNDIGGEEFPVYMDNLSISGVRIKSHVDLPVQFGIKLRMVFTLRGETFHQKGIFKRKEAYSGIQTITYGVKFIEMRQKDEKRLASILNTIQREQHYKFA